MCQDQSRRFWSREPTEAELSTCVKVATEDTASESDPRRRWAYTCAALLTAAGFLTF